jgi:bifunctional DNA-binding transcriptional regulator/antitoxin component of YhaV-PrlF toxin-antitoxin module
METRTHAPNVVVLGPEGNVTLPRQVLEHSQFGVGDRIFVTDLSDDAIVLKKLDPNKTVFDMLTELGEALRAAGYDTPEKVDALVDEVKLEVTEEWLARIGIHRTASS